MSKQRPKRVGEPHQNLQERVEASRIEVLHLDRRSDVGRNTAGQHTIAPDAFLMEAPSHILRSTDLSTVSIDRSSLEKERFLPDRVC